MALPSPSASESLTPEATAFQQNPILDDASHITALSFASPSVCISHPAAPRHLQASRHLPQPSLLCSVLRLCQSPAADRCGPRQLPPCPALWALGHCMARAPAGMRDCIYSTDLPISLPLAMLLEAPSGMPPRQTIIKRPKESQAPAVRSLPPVFPLCAGPRSRRRCGLGWRGLPRGFPGHRGTLARPERCDSPAGSLLLPPLAGTEP